MRHSTGKYVLLMLLAGLATGAVDPKPLSTTIDQEEYLESDDWFDAGVVLNTEGHYREAAEAFSRSVALSPGNALAWLNLGTAQALYGEYDRAIESLKKSIALDPKLPLAFSNLGEVCFRADRYLEAIEAYTTLLTLWPGNANAIYKIGLSHLILNDIGKAQAEYLSLKIVDPTLAEKLKNAIMQGAVD